jgi:hypothetical protein
MALILLNAGREPLGEFDGLDSQYLNFKGGEVCTWTAVTLGADLASADVNDDGYVGVSPMQRPAVTYTLTATSAPLFLADDGNSPNYGTLFGQVVGGVAGQIATGGAILGPPTATGSGKITLWDKQGLYGVTLDAVDTAATGLVPTNSALTVGTALTYTATGQLTPNRSVNSINGTGSNSPIVGYLSEFQTNGSLVTTPQSLVAALNSPSSDVSSLQQEKFFMAVFSFVGV